MLVLAATSAALGPVALDGASRMASALIALGAGATLWLGGIVLTLATGGLHACAT